MGTSSIWPRSDNDPFQQQKHGEQQSNLNNLSSSWENTSRTQQDHIPKWTLQTDEEQTDQQKAIRAMESKLKHVKRQHYSEITPMSHNNIDIGNPCTNDEEYDDDDYGLVVEDQEGLSLLWQERYTSEGLEEALLHQKKDRQYLSSSTSLFSWLDSWCMCCRRSPTD